MPTVPCMLRRVYPAMALGCALLCSTATQGQMFSAATNVSQSSTGNASYPVMVIDSAGNVNVAWIDSVSGIYFARSTDSGQTFSTAAPIGNITIGATFQPQMVVDPTQSLVEIAWAKPSTAAGAPAGTFDVFLSQLAIGTLPVTKQLSLPTTPVKLVDSPRLAFDPTGVDVVWGNTETWIVHSPDGALFTTPASSPTKLSIAPQDSGGPRIAVDKSGNIFVAWTDRLAQDQNQSGNYCTNPMGTTDPTGVMTVFSNVFGGNVYFNETASGSTPSSGTTKNLSSTDWKNAANPRWPNGYFGCSYDTLQLFFDQNDNLHLLWADDTPTEELLSSTAMPQSSGPPLFTFPTALAGGEGASSPSGAADANGHIYAVWAAGPQAPSNTAGIYFSRSDNNGASFPEANVVSAPAAIAPAFPQIAVDKNDNVNVVWEQADQAITAGGNNTFHLLFAHSDTQGAFPTVRPVSSNSSVLCLPPSAAFLTTPDTTICGTEHIGLDINSNADITWVNNPGSGAGSNIDFSVANVAPGVEPPNDFSIAATPASQSAYSGQTVTFNVTSQSMGTFNSPITLGCNDFPELKTPQGVRISRSDFSCTFNPPSINPGGTATAAMLIPWNLTGNDGASYSFNINGTSGGTTHRVRLGFTDLGAAGSVQPDSATVALHASATFTVTIINPNAFSGSVSFQCAGQPVWIQCAFNPPSVNPSAGASSTLTVSVVSSPAGSLVGYPVSPRDLSQRVLRSVTFAALGLIAFVIIYLRHRDGMNAARLLRVSAVMALTLLLAIGLTSCFGASPRSSASAVDTGTGGSGANSGGSASNPVTATFMVQAQSGNGITNLGAVSITVTP
jgi:hypothetical protein